jgi:hypothetical protein
MRNAGDVFFRSVFRYEPDQLTVFPGAVIPGTIFTVGNTVKKFRLGVGGQKYDIAPTLILQ